MATPQGLEIAIEQRESARPGRRWIFIKGHAWRIALMGWLLVLLVMAVGADFIMPHDPYQQSLSDKLKPPAWAQGGKAEHLLGTDSLGRDILSRVILGARVSLVLSVLSIIIGTVVGTGAGLIGGYFGGQVDNVVTGLANAALAFPIILIGLILAVLLGPTMMGVVLAISLVVWARYARVVRGQALSLRRQDFVEAARMIGCSPLRILALHIFPNVFNSIIVLATLQIGWAIITEASLSFLGAGVPPPIPSWGKMVAEGKDYLLVTVWLAALPGLFIALTVLTFSFLGDALRDILDPRLRQM